MQACKTQIFGYLWHLLLFSNAFFKAQMWQKVEEYVSTTRLGTVASGHSWKKGVSAEFPGIQLNPPHLDRGLCVSLAINRERGKYQQTKKTKKNGEISAKVPEDLPKYRSLRHKTNHTLNFGSIRMGTCIQKYGCKQLVSAVDALMPKMGIYEKFDVLTAIANLRILENEFIFLVMLII